MRVPPEKIPNVINFLQKDFPALVCQTAGIDDSDEYWERVDEQTNYIATKYKKNSFVVYMLSAYIGYLEKQRDEQKRRRR